MPAGRVTMRDVADASGVSRATVSFVLNNAPDQTISPATRERVERVARDLGYVPHGIARALREGVSRIVVLNISTSLEGQYSQTYIHGLDDELARHGHVLLVQHREPTPESRQQMLDVIAPRAVLRFAESYLSGEEYDEDVTEYTFAQHAATQIDYLAGRGHRRIAMALPPTDPLKELRFHFATRAAERLRLPPLARFDLTTDSVEAGAGQLRRFLDEHPEVTAMAALLDDTALRVIKAALTIGLAVPDDLAVIGYDATEYAALSTPSLTTVEIDAEAHGRQAARRVLGLDESDLVLKPARVIVRESA